MPTLNVGFTDDEYDALKRAKLKASAEVGKELGWHDFILFMLQRK